MSFSKRVLRAINDAEMGEYDVALLHACIGIDATAKKLFPADKQNGRRYIKCIRKYYWLIEPMIGAGLNLEETRFENLEINGKRSPDFAEVIYHIFRCSHVHGDEVPKEYSILPSVGHDISAWTIARGELHMPERVLWALLAVCVFSDVNSNMTSSGSHFLSLGGERFLISQWWGREKDFRNIAGRYNVTRVKLDKLDKLVESDNNLGSADKAEAVIITQPYVNQ